MRIMHNFHIFITYAPLWFDYRVINKSDADTNSHAIRLCRNK